MEYRIFQWRAQNLAFKMYTARCSFRLITVKEEKIESDQGLI